MNDLLAPSPSLKTFPYLLKKKQTSGPGRTALPGRYFIPISSFPLTKNLSGPAWLQLSYSPPCLHEVNWHHLLYHVSTTRSEGKNDLTSYSSTFLPLVSRHFGCWSDASLIPQSETWQASACYLCRMAQLAPAYLDSQVWSPPDSPSMCSASWLGISQGICLLTVTCYS